MPARKRLHPKAPVYTLAPPPRPREPEAYDSGWVAGCKCSSPQIVQFGKAALCIQHACLWKWCWVQSLKFRACRAKLGLIKNAKWQKEFTEFLPSHFWRQIAQNAKPSVNWFSLSDAAQVFLNKKIQVHAEHIESNRVEQILEQEYQQSRTAVAPERAVLVEQVSRGVPTILLLYWSEQLTALDCSILRDESIYAFEQWSTQEMHNLRARLGIEVQDGR